MKLELTNHPQPINISCSSFRLSVNSTGSFAGLYERLQGEKVCVPFLPLAERPVTGGKWLLGVAP